MTNIITSSGEVFTESESRLLAQLVLKRFGGKYYTYDAWQAWKRLLNNNCSIIEFEKLIATCSDI